MPQVSEATTRVSAGGRIVIPAKFRKEIGLKEGDEVILQLEEGALRIVSRERALQDIQEYVCSLVPPDVSLADELIQERREEAARE